MRERLMKQKLCLSMLVTALCLMLVQPRVRAAGDFEIQKLADGVCAALRNHPPLMSFDTNNVFIGNQVWREAFPNVEFVAHASTLRDRPAIGDANRQQMLSGGRGYAEYLRKQVAQNKSLAGAELTEEERVNYLADAAWIERALAEAPQVKILPPTLTIEDRLMLQRGKRTIDIRFLGRGHTGADLIA